MPASPAALAEQLQSQRRRVDFDTFDVLLQQLVTMIDQNQIDVAPTYQRQFRWEQQRCSQLIESVMLGIPVPSLFMATNADGTWELVDGVQRISAIVKFVGNQDVRDKMRLGDPLRLVGLEKLDNFNGLLFSDLPASIQLQFMNRPIKVVTLNDKSDDVVRFDLFERLNRGGVNLTEQEIRDCVYRGAFADLLEKLSTDQNFRSVVKLTPKQNRDGTREECVLRFFAFLNSYKSFIHSVRDFLNNYMRSSARSFDYVDGEAIFRNTFVQLAAAFPNGIVRPGRRTRSTTPLNLYEGVAVGAALALQRSNRLKTAKIMDWLGSRDLLEVTTGATNNPAAVKKRIEYCRDRFLGK